MMHSWFSQTTRARIVDRWSVQTLLNSWPVLMQKNPGVRLVPERGYSYSGANGFISCIGLI